ncbi:MAG: hypothetical protein QM756_18450, partial [Polyangiaceae bacterium]
MLDATPSPQNAAALLTALSRTSTQLVLAGAVDLAARLLERVEASLDQVSSDPATLGWVFEARAVTAGTGRDPSARVSLAEEAARCFTQAGDFAQRLLARDQPRLCLRRDGRERARRASAELGALTRRALGALQLDSHRAGAPGP